MGKINLQPMEPPPKPELAVRVGYRWLKNVPADRPLSLEEIAAEEGATRYPKSEFPRIPPVPGTIAFFIRNMQGGNAAIIEQLKNLIGPGTGAHGETYRKIKDIVILWMRADDFSKKRIDIFDIICEQAGISKRKVWGWINEAIFDFTEEYVKMHIQTSKINTVDNILEKSEKDRNQQDRRLAAEISGLTEGSGTKVVVDNSTNISDNRNQSVVIPSFVKTIRAAESNGNGNKKLKEAPENRMLSEGNTDFIEGELIEEKQKELVERK